MYREDGREDRSVVVVGINGRVIGLDAMTGELRFEHELGPVGDVEIAIHRGQVFATLDGRHVWCFGYPEGERRWDVSLEVRYRGSPTLLAEEDRLYVSCAGEVVCMTVAGDVVWHEPLKGRGVASLTLALPGHRRGPRP